MINKLKARVEQEFGGKVVTVKNCQRLSESIKERCKIGISDSTLRRVWGLLSGPRKPSINTLDLLSQYIGLNSWDEFLSINSGMQVLENSSSLWQIGKRNAHKISTNTISVIFKKSGVVSSNVVFRQCIDDHIVALLGSDYLAISIIAPGGYGKSLGVASWVDRVVNRTLFKNSIVCFLTGSQVDDLYSHSMSIDSWLSNLVFKSHENVFADNELFKDRNFIFIVDALDEIDSTMTKSTTFLSKVVEFVSKYSGKKHIKVIVTTRSSVWGRSMAHEVIGNKNAASQWMGLSFGAFDSDTTNLPLLNHKEMQEAFNNFINKKSKDRRLLVEQINFMLKETISHPYMLKLFISIYNNDSLKLQNYNDVIDEFISREIAHAKYADEKLDIINFMLQEQQYGKKLQAVRKNALKDRYPINLRKSGNYFAAYEHLLAFCILSEETFENRFKNLIVQVDFSHSNLRDLLITRYLVEANGGITHDLFVKVDREYSDSDLRIRLISNLYSIAYSENDFDAIRNFHRLPDSISKDREILRFIVHQFRNDKPILQLLAQEYGQDSFVKEFLINTYFDFDYLNISFYKVLDLVLSSATTKNEQIYSLAGLAISRAQQLDHDEFLAFSDHLKDLSLDDSCGAYCVMIWAVWQIYYAQIINREMSSDDLFDELFRAETIFERKAEQNPLSFFLFYLELLPHIILFKNSFLAKRILELINKHPLKVEMDKDPKLTMLYDLYRLDIMSIEDKLVKLSPMKLYSLEQQINALSISQSYMNRVSGYVLLACSYMQQDDKHKFVYYYQTALEICSNANFKLLEISKIKHLADMLDEYKMHVQAKQFRDFSVTVVGMEFSSLYDIV